eukprot:CAMPEP_0196761982 /NCGR_PEP_ID=MMETSP1095-20130614/1310_1 /TAXON_ID=96789 ORGANISM="Chromulina nebulosa, Strain UTEXLB2642" /NCGR_SAMPLE_ID=MMETSP1095 /ASSEMBLY_ACC=CAM_ASM_000446 /LENGTH=818 /DNA_ID=CAMNT_0042112171 /DNA_START=51 /DNA_END=2507 /DNA_ORIENTATION=+
MVDQAFIGAGKQLGLELWRIENLKPVKTEVTGKFYEGDSYILLSTSKKSNAFAWNIHFWLGKDTTQDEAGVAAYKTVELDDSLGGGPVQYRELQGSETELFLSYFKNFGGLQYLPGGIESGFKHVERDVYTTRLLHLKGKRTVRVTEVPVTVSSLNSGDVFILDKGLTVYLFFGEKSNKFERAKGVDVASYINGDERGGRAEIIIVNEDITNADFWNELGGYVDPSSLPEGESDDIVEAHKKVARLFKVSDASGSVEFTEIPLEDKKLRKSLLNGDDVFIVFGTKVYIWVGKKSTPLEKKEAFPRAISFLASQGLPTNTPIERVSEGAETAAFKAEFAVWNPPVSFGLKTSAQSNRVEDQVDISALIQRKAEEDKPIDDGSGKLLIWVIHDFKLVPVPPEKYGQFYGGDSYVLLYTYVKNNREKYILYFWLGNDSSADERGSAALLTKEYDDRNLKGQAVQIRVTQGKEPAHFRQLFKGYLVIHSGGLPSGFRNKVETESTPEVALYHIKGTNPLNTYGIHVPVSASSLNSEDSFVLTTPSTVYVWVGNAANTDERTVATNIAGVLSQEGKIIVPVTEGEEPGDFWDSIGGIGEYAKLSPGVSAPQEARLYHASTATGVFRVDEVDNFDQTDLNDEDVFLLDTYTQLFVWIGSQSTAEEKQKSLALAERFVAEASITDGRDSDIPIITILAGNEPDMFISHFRTWDSEYTKKHSFTDPYQAKLAALAKEKEEKLKELVGSSSTVPSTPAPAVPVSASVSSTYSLEQLTSGIPPGVDPTKKEKYLDSKTFAQVFGSTIEEFAALPKWKQDKKKKEVGLF